jgi:hypothetical protein
VHHPFSLPQNLEGLPQVCKIRLDERTSGLVRLNKVGVEDLIAVFEQVMYHRQLSRCPRSPRLFASLLL